MSDSAHNTKRWLKSVAEELERSSGHWPSEEEVADSLGLSVEDVRMLGHELPGPPATDLEKLAGSDCQDESLESGPSLDLSSRLRVCPTEPSEAVLARSIRQRAKRLSPLHRKVLVLYYFENLRLPEIAEICGKSQSLIAQIQAECIQIIRQAMQACADRTE